MHAAVLKAHPTDPNTLILDTPPDLKHVMGRFEAARYTSNYGYLFHIDHLDAMRRFLQLNNVAVMDDRPQPTAGPPRYRRGQEPVLKCAACGYTQREDSCQTGPDECGNCGRCHNCGANQLGPHFVTADEQADINHRGLAALRTPPGTRYQASIALQETVIAARNRVRNQGDH